MPDSICKTLLPPNNRTALEIALEQAQGCGINNMPVPLRDLWRVDSCPAELLPWLAWTLSVDVWDDEWNEQQKRNVIRASVEIHKHKGTLFAVEQAIIALGVDANITEWWQDKAHIGRGRFHIDIKATDTGIDTGIKQQTLRRFIEHSKRLSALYAVFITDQADLKIVTDNAVLSRFIDRTIPVLQEKATCLDAIQVGISGHFKEQKGYQQFACVDGYKTWLETANKRHYDKPNLALRVVSKDSDVVTSTSTEASADLSVLKSLNLNIKISADNVPEQWQSNHPLSIAFESSNRKTAKKPDLALRLTTRDIAIATDTSKEERATLLVQTAMAGLARVENLSIRSEMVVEAQQSLATTNQLQGHFQQQASLPTTFFAQNGADIGLLTSNQAVNQTKNNLAMRVITRNEAVDSHTRKESKANIISLSTTVAIGIARQHHAKASETAQHIIVSTWAMLGLIQDQKPLAITQIAQQKTPIGIVLMTTTYDHSSAKMTTNAVMKRQQQAVFFGLIRQLNNVL